ncbi:hypothetical protein EVAR_103450_1 [Eumeta japonica]|uniref:Uncharacterized protein n=1 Tax=Eumeta variegata TaxID=151549 RepID=A0A4C1Z6J2_EUMVA|nr:hypothetical protein EVAR_103450_1 [Eumeta japonica]
MAKERPYFARRRFLRKKRRDYGAARSKISQSHAGGDFASALRSKAADRTDTLLLSGQCKKKSRNNPKPAEDPMRMSEKSPANARVIANAF